MYLNTRYSNQLNEKSAYHDLWSFVPDAVWLLSLTVYDFSNDPIATLKISHRFLHKTTNKYSLLDKKKKKKIIYKTKSLGK